VRLIDTEESAKRLARVILSDIEIYNRQKVWSQADLKPQLDEGYAFFRSRVAPALVPLFSNMVADRWLDPAANPAAVARGPAPRTAAAAVQPRHQAPPPRPVARPAGPPPAAPWPVAMQARLRGALDPKEAARRLARVMASSIQGCDRPDGGAGLAADIQEARTLFQSCVLPEVAPLFEDALAELGLLEQQPLPAHQAPEPAPPMLVSPFESTQAVPTPTAAPDPDEDLPTLVMAGASSPKLPPLVERSSWKAWLAAGVLAVATAAASMVYLLLTA
jgi:hypothetical protein